KCLANLKKVKLPGDQQFGINILRQALAMPLKKIAMNAGHEGSIIIEKVKKSRNKNYGFDALNEKYTDMISAGIIDPTKVVRTALQNAASVSGLLLTTEGLVSEIPEKEKAAPAMPPGGGMY
ncbi:MAG TPA: TCP-1/cpn60 chaperonin family protein, partial [Candidatus Aminicenantes bacterium]|nr:TCP-1/cpn60 chaperonin family protein [Candidatus Aminicenantes bacterium]